jgi:hypothetical protein
MSMDSLLVGVVMPVLAAVAWLGSIVCAVGMFRHRDRSKSFWWFAWNGHAFWLSREGFTVDAKPWHRRFLACTALFALVLAAGVAWTLMQPVAPPS